MHLPKLMLYWTGSIVPLYATWYLFSSYFYWLTQLSVFATLSVIAWTIAYRLYQHLHADKVSAQNKAVLVTGCDSGFGHQLAQRLDSYGFTVFAGVRLFSDGEGAKSLVEKCSERLRVLPMDVTKPEEVDNVVREIKKSKIPLWAIVNNAGVAFECPFDWGNDVDVYRKTFDVNVFGLVRVTKSCMPLLRQSKGRVINVASVAGRISVPIISHYCMAKHSVRVFSDVMRRELYNEDIKVVTIEPTFYQTPIIDFDQINRTRESIYEQTPTEIKGAYSTSYLKSFDHMEKLVHLVSRKNVNEVVDTMEKAVTLLDPLCFYRCCGYHEVVIWAVALLPETLLDAMVNNLIYGKYSVKIAIGFEWLKGYIGQFANKTK